MLKQRIWKIEGYDGDKKILEKELMYSHYSENQIKCLLKALTAKAGLDFEQMIGAYASKHSRIYNQLLEVRMDQAGYVYSCGNDPSFTARVLTLKDS